MKAKRPRNLKTMSFLSRQSQRANALVVKESPQQNSIRKSNLRWSLGAFKRKNHLTGLSATGSVIRVDHFPRTNIECDDSDLESLSAILGGPYNPLGNSDQKHSSEIGSQSFLTEGSRNVDSSTHQFPNQSIKVVSCRSDCDPSVIENELRAFEEKYAANKTPNSSFVHTTNRRATLSLKSRFTRLVSPRQVAGNADVTKSEGDEVLQYGGKTVVIHWETQDARNNQSQMSSAMEKTFETPKQISNARLRFHGIANALKRNINIGRLIFWKGSHFDNLSTDSSNVSDYDIDAYSDDESETSKFHAENSYREELLIPRLFDSCGCGMTY